MQELGVDLYGESDNGIRRELPSLEQTATPPPWPQCTLLPGNSDRLPGAFGTHGLRSGRIFPVGCRSSAKARSATIWLLRLGHRYQQRTDWHTPHPSGARSIHHLELFS